MNSKLNIGILGCANIAKKYAIRVFQSLDEIDEIWIASRDIKKSKSVANDFGILSANSYEAIINHPKINAVYIPLPVGLHEEWAIKAANAKKHIICEKSLSHSLLSAKNIINICNKNKVVLYENFMCDYHPQHKAVRTLIEKNEIGELITFTGYFGFSNLDSNDIRYNKDIGGGSLNDVGAYPVFMSRKIFASEPESVTCTLEKNSEGLDIRGSAFLEFPNHRTAFISFGFNNNYQNNYSVWGTKGLLEVSRAYSIPPELKPSIDLTKNQNGNDKKLSIDAPAANHFELLFEDFCQTVINENHKKREAMTNLILKQAIVLEAMRISSQQNIKISIESLHHV